MRITYLKIIIFNSSSFIYYLTNILFSASNKFYFFDFLITFVSKFVATRCCHFVFLSDDECEKIIIKLYRGLLQGTEKRPQPQ